MKGVYSPDHRAHSADRGSWVGVTIPSEEVPERVEKVVDALRAAGLHRARLHCVEVAAEIAHT